MIGSRARPGLAHRTLGFTLLEILVFLVVLGLLFVGLNQEHRLGARLWDRHKQELDAVGDLDATDRALRGLIEQMDSGGRIETSDIEGSARTLRFISWLPAVAGQFPTRRVEVMLLVDRQHRLVLRWSPSPHVAVASPGVPVDTVLLADIDHIELAYRASAAASAWDATWQSPSPPRLVRVHFGFAPNDPRRWPDLVAAPMHQRGGS